MEMLSVGPVLILGICQRSGTNYLYDLVRMHPDCSGTEPWEDYLIHHSDLLLTYTDSVAAHWPEKWNVSKKELNECIGSGLHTFIKRKCVGMLAVSKTPSVRNLNNVINILPEARVLIVVRDGRSVVGSGMKSFSWDFEWGIRLWRDGAQCIEKLLNNSGDIGASYMVINYEELYQNTRIQMERVLSFLDLDMDAYDFDSVDNLAIRGSSGLKESRSDELHWKACEKTVEFTPLDRWSTWGRTRHERFNWIAGRELEAMGYKTRKFHGSKMIWYIYNKIADIRAAIYARISLARD